jgi:hypothetical protein
LREFGLFGREWNDFFAGFFWDPVQRRGVHVNTPKIGSRVGVFCFGGILEFCAELRREFKWGNLNLMVFRFLGGCPRGTIEEGGRLCVFGGIIVR